MNFCVERNEAPQVTIHSDSSIDQKNVEGGGGAVAEWSKVLLWRKEIYEKTKRSQV